MGYLVDRTHRELSDEEDRPHLSRLAREKEAGKYEDVSGFCKSAATEEIAAHGYLLTPGCYVGAEAVEDEDEPFEEKMKRLVAKREEQFAESKKLEEQIRANLKGLGYGS